MRNGAYKRLRLSKRCGCHRNVAAEDSVVQQTFKHLKTILRNLFTFITRQKFDSVIGIKRIQHWRGTATADVTHVSWVDGINCYSKLEMFLAINIAEFVPCNNLHRIWIKFVVLINFIFYFLHVFIANKLRAWCFSWFCSRRQLYTGFRRIQQRVSNTINRNSIGSHRRMNTGMKYRSFLMFSHPIIRQNRYWLALVNKTWSPPQDKICTRVQI